MVNHGGKFSIYTTQKDRIDKHMIKSYLVDGKINPIIADDQYMSYMICLYIYDDDLVGGIPTPLKNDGARQLG